MLKQHITGLQSRTLDFKEGSDETALASLLAGRIETYELKSSGGVAMNTTPAVLNRKNFIVGKDTPTGRLSAMIQVPHVKESFFFNELIAAVKGKFDATYTSEVKCDYVKLKFDKLS
ncbi:hypothetical protein [Campylobacter sp. RM9328]|uniref:hypothetical protein n=1 Tax=Campylobacter sp. RM9328 TaxID=1705720 RepID=UPI0014737F53|nr:hypothetical protein [Campylobacter sp. RM9328]